MAGAFGGDDNGFMMEDPDEVENEENEEDEEDEEDEEESMNSIQKKIFELEEKRLRPKLKNILDRVRSSQFPFLNPFDKKTVQQAKAHKNLKKEVLELELALNMKKTQLTSKVASIVAPALPYILIGGLIIIAFIVAVAFIASIIPWLFPDDDLGSGGGAGGGSASAQFGVTGKDFYGVRTIYSDTELSRAGLLEEYSTIIDNTVEEVLKIEHIKESEGVTYTVSVKVNLEIPKIEVESEEPKEYDYKNFDEDTFKTEYSDYYNILNAMAEKVYVKDNPTGTIPTKLIDRLDGILYYGIGEELTTELSNLIYNRLLTLYSTSVTDGTNIVENASLTNEFKTNFENKVTGTINNLYSIINKELLTHTNRSEKLFIKDYIFSSEEDMMKNIEKQNYVAWIFMPKNNVEFNKISLNITHSDFDNFEIKLFNDGGEINLKKEENDYSDLGNFGSSKGEENSENSEKTYLYIANNLNENASVFTNIDDKANELSSGLSLAEIVSNSELNNDVYLMKNENGIYTFNLTGIYVTFKSDVSFSCVEFETLWK